MKRKQMLLAGTLLSSIFLISACNLFDSNDTNKEPNGTETAKVTTSVEQTTASENSIIAKNAQELFNKMLNISKLETEEEKYKVITNVLYDPAAYYKTLTDSNTIIPTEAFYKMSASHSDIKIEKVGPNHYYYSSLVTIEKQEDISSKPAMGKSYLSMELKEVDGVLKIVRLSMNH